MKNPAKWAKTVQILSTITQKSAAQKINCLNFIPFAVSHSLQVIGLNMKPHATSFHDWKYRLHIFSPWLWMWLWCLNIIKVSMVWLFGVHVHNHGPYKQVKKMQVILSALCPWLCNSTQPQQLYRWSLTTMAQDISFHEIPLTGTVATTREAVL